MLHKHQEPQAAPRLMPLGVLVITGTVLRTRAAGGGSSLMLFRKRRGRYNRAGVWAVRGVGSA